MAREWEEDLTSREENLDILAYQIGLEPPSTRAKTLDKLYPELWEHMLYAHGEKRAMKERERRTGRTTIMLLNAILDMIDEKDTDQKTRIFVGWSRAVVLYLQELYNKLILEIAPLYPDVDFKNADVVFLTFDQVQGFVGRREYKIYFDHTCEEEKEREALKIEKKNRELVLN